MPRCCRQVLLEGALQVRLVGETGCLCHLGDSPPLAQLRPRQLHALVEQIAVGGQPEMLAKRADQVGTRKATGSTDILKPQCIAAMGTDERGCGLQPWVTHFGGLRTALQQGGQFAEQRGQARLAVRHTGIEQLGKSLQQPLVQQGRGAECLHRQGEPQRLQPRPVDEQHQIGPRLPCNRVAGMHDPRVHQDGSARRNLMALIAIEVGAAPTGDHPNGKAFVGMRGIAHLAPVAYLAGLDKG